MTPLRSWLIFRDGYSMMYKKLPEIFQLFIIFFFFSFSPTRATSFSSFFFFMCVYIYLVYNYIEYVRAQLLFPMKFLGTLNCPIERTRVINHHSLGLYDYGVRGAILSALNHTSQLLYHPHGMHTITQSYKFVECSYKCIRSLL